MGAGKIDQFFRLLLLALLEDLIPAADGTRTLPEVAELTRSLTDPEAPATYGSQVAIHQYPIFRGLIDELCDSPLFRGPRAEHIHAKLRPFDDYFRNRMPDPTVDARIGLRHHTLEP